MPDYMQPEPAQLFYSYAHEDEALREMLEKHLKLLQRQGLLVSWHDRLIQAGEHWQHTIDEHLETAAIILLLISPDFLASRYCYDIEMQRALERQQAGQAHVIPLILRPCDWHTAPFGYLQALPRDGQPVTTWPNQDEAFLQVSRSLRALLTQPVPVGQTNRSEMQNRANMLVKLQRMYDEVLDDSLQKLAWINLPLASVPGAVHTTANLLLRRANLPAQPLTPGTTVQQVYQQANQELLILGDPGAGKSTLLYQLGRDLLAQAQHITHPFPVVFPLSSWAPKRLPLQEWMVEQLCSPLYEIPHRQSWQWVQNQQILPLLDGLDEVEEAARPACIATINTFRSAFPLCPLVVCSRSQEYHATSQDERLHLYSAVEVQPLTERQQEEALRQVGTTAQVLRGELASNAELRELARKPLWLNVLLVTTREAPLLTLPQERLALQQEVLRRYVWRMCERKGNAIRYPVNQTTHWLRFLARQMRRQNQVVFSLEEFQLDWLAKRSWRAYRWSVGLLAGLASGLVAGLSGPLVAGPLIGVAFGLFMGPVLANGQKGTLAESFIWSWKGIRSGLLAGLAVGLLAGLEGQLFGKPVGELFGVPVNHLLVDLLGGLIVGPAVGLLVGLASGHKSKGTLVERLVWSWEGIRSMLPFGVLFGLLVGWLSTLPVEQGGQSGGLVAGLASGLLFGVLFGLVFGLKGEQVVERDTSSPGKGIYLSLRNGLLVGLVMGLVVGMAVEVAVGLVDGLVDGLLFGLVDGLLFGLVMGLLFGLGSAFQHLMIRFWLARAGRFPWQALAFLNDACERALLKRVGGTYRFIHRLVLDYFADLPGKPSLRKESVVLPTVQRKRIGDGNK